ncbi:MAG: response regulator [Halanaerobiales bacterium]|nr:response regulator [Halanaerobiales bacterium]
MIKILVIDDNKSFRQSLQIILGDLGYDLDFAKDAEVGKAKISQDSYDIVLLDLKLPAEREGLEVLEFIKKFNSDIVVIMMTGYGDVPTAVKAIKLGAEDFVEKDSDFDDHLVVKLERITERIILLKDREDLIHLLWEQTLKENDRQSKGKLLEQLCTSIFKSIPDLTY